MANEDYTLVRLDDNIADGAVLTYDAARDLITDSGLIASQGELQANAGTLSVGLQDMSSAGEQVVWMNTDSHVIYAPPWHVLDEVNTEGSKDRIYGALQTVTRFADRSAILENPVFPVHVPTEEVVFRLDMTFPIAQNNVEFKVTHAGHEMWREVKDVSAGKQEIRLDIPIAFHPGDYQFSIQPYGDVRLSNPVQVMGNPATGQVGYSVVFRPFEDKTLATQEYVIAQVVGGAADEIMLKKDYDSNNDGIVDLAHAVKGATTSGNDKYYGTDSTGAVGFHLLPAGVDVSALQTQIDANKQTADAAKAEAAANKIEIDKHETAINGHGTQLAANTSQIETNKNNIDVALQRSQSALDESGVVRRNGVNAITADVDSTHKTITIKLLSTAGVVDTALIDLSSWFAVTPTPQPGDDHKVYFGFAVNPPLTEANIIGIGQTKEVSTIANLDVSMTRTGTTPSYMWMWIPDAAGAVKGFSFSNFLSVWSSTAITVAGVAGKFYVSPNPTTAQSVEFEVSV